MTMKSFAREISKENSHYLHTLFFFQGNTSYCIRRCGKKVNVNNEVRKETKTSRFQKAKYQEEACNEIQDQSCYSQKASRKEKTRANEVKVKSVNSLATSDIETAPESSVESEIRKAKKAKVKSVNSLAVSDLETAPGSSLESEIRNDSIDLCTEHEKTKESFSDGKKDVNGVTKQNNDSNLSKQPEKTKEASSSKIKGHHQTHDKKRSVKILDLGVNSDCSEPESKSEDKSRQRTDIEPKISVQEIKEKQQVEPESLVQDSSVEQEI